MLALAAILLLGPERVRMALRACGEACAEAKEAREDASYARSLTGKFSDAAAKTNEAC